MCTYIKKDYKGYYVETIDQVDPILWEGRIGTTYDDFLNNKWVLLSDEQVAFHNENKHASVREVLNMQLDQYVAPARTLEDAKNEKLQQIVEYDNSNAVNSFTINGNPMWLNVEERQQLATQISANEAAGRETMTRWFNGSSFTFPITVWKQMLVALEIYAGDALNVTETHKAAINELDTIETVDSYNYTTGYPTKLIF